MPDKDLKGLNIIQFRQLPIGIDAKGGLREKGGGQEGRQVFFGCLEICGFISADKIDLQGALGAIDRVASLELCDRLPEELAIKIEADGGNMS